MMNWFRRRREARQQIEQMARDYIAEYGDQAYYKARERMMDAAMRGDHRENEMWTLVRADIRKLTGHPGSQGDTATRMLEAAYRRGERV